MLILCFGKRINSLRVEKYSKSPDRFGARSLPPHTGQHTDLKVIAEPEPRASAIFILRNRIAIVCPNLVRGRAAGMKTKKQL